MIRGCIRLVLCVVVFLALPRETPAPLIYRPGEGWIWEPVGGAKWRRTRAKEQLEVAQAAFDQKDFKTAMRASRHGVNTWPMSDYAPNGQYLLGRCYEEVGKDEKAFNTYQSLLTKYPKVDNYEEVLQRQYAIANRFLAGQWFKLWGVVPFFPSMDKTAEMYDKLIKNGPYSDVAPFAQLSIGTAREKQSDYAAAVKAYEKAADRYHDMEKVVPDALYKAGEAYHKQAKTADYDQGIAGQSIATFSDFAVLYPNEPRVAGVQKVVADLKAEQARGSYSIAKFYEKKKNLDAALIYYNEVLVKDSTSKYAEEARQRIESIKQKKVQQSKEK